MADNTPRSLLTGLAVAALAGTHACAERNPQHARSAGAEERGRAVALRVGCDACHVIGGDATTTQFQAAAPLAGIAHQTFIVGVLANTQKNLARFIYNPRSIKAHTNMPRLAVTEAEATDIAAYLYSLK